MQTDIRVIRAEPSFPMARCRTPLKFGAVVVEELPFCHVALTVENRAGRTAQGLGAMFLMDLWAWPVSPVEHPERMQAMIAAVKRLCDLYVGHTEFAHPLDLFADLEPHLKATTDRVSRELDLAENMPLLATLVCTSPIDAAVHDAFGRAAGISTFDGYGPEHCAADLSRHLGPAFKGKYVSDVIRPMPGRMPAFHLVGGLDKLCASEITDGDPRDGLPVSLDQWIRYENLRWLKIKLGGRDLDWDLDRLLSVVSIAHEEQDKAGATGLEFSADTNEQCESPAHMVELLTKLKERRPQAYEELLYVEQPTERDLRAHRWDMRELAALKPVVIDESLMTLDDFELALELGWSGVALKACKCQSAALVFAAKAAQQGIAYTVQDLTNPGLALVQSVALASHLSPLRGVETNSRQFFPAANGYIADRHPGLVRLDGGQLDTSSIRGPGIGYQADGMQLPHD